jgi:hypothetical protein
MSNVIQFLESMGANAAMARMSFAEYQTSVALLDADDMSRQALSLRSPSNLNDALEGRRQMMCVVFSPDENERPSSPDQESEENPDEDKPQGE